MVSTMNLVLIKIRSTRKKFNGRAVRRRKRAFNTGQATCGLYLNVCICSKLSRM